jgi:cell division cycle 14
MNLASVIDFIKLLDVERASFPNSKIVFCVAEGRRSLTNAVFLLGAYMILKLEMASSKVAQRFRWLDPTSVEPYRDATYCRPDFQLHLIDCWRGLEKGRSHGWVRYASSGFLWGDVDVDEYKHYDSPANGNLHEVVPGKFVAFQGPKELDGADYRDDARGWRAFSPGFYAEILHGMGVVAVVRLNEPHYDAEGFTSRGLTHHSLEFEDCTQPPDAVVDAFLRTVDAAAPGAVAVHCKAGLGRTGTLIALYLMRSCGFGARDAMGWLRIMRPGSVIGEQQHYLCAVEQQGAAAAAAATTTTTTRPGFLRARASASMPGRTMAAELAAELAAERAAQVAGGMERRSASVATQQIPPPGGGGRGGGGGGGQSDSDEETEDAAAAAAAGSSSGA